MGGLHDKRQAVMESVMKDAIFEATVKVLTEHGFDGLTMDRVADSTGVAKGTLYNYFKDKDSLVRYAGQRVFEVLFKKVEKIARSGMNPVDTLATIAAAIINMVNENLDFLFILAEYHSHHMLNAEKCRDMLMDGIKIITPVIEEGVRTNALRSVNPTRTAAAFLGALHQLIHVIIEVEGSRPSAKNVDELMGLFLHGAGQRKHA